MKEKEKNDRIPGKDAKSRKASSVVLREDVVLPIAVVTFVIAIVAFLSGQHILGLQFAFVALGALWMASKFYDDED